MDQACSEVKQCFNGHTDRHSNADCKLLFVTIIHKTPYQIKECGRCGLVFHTPSTCEFTAVQQYNC